VPIPIASEATPHFGFYVFGWQVGAKAGLERFDLHQLTWILLLQALSFRQASVSQDAMKGRMFSIVAHNLAAPVFKMRSDLGVLRMGFFEDQPVQRQEKYIELLRQARHMTGIIDGILSLSARETGVAFDNVSLANVVYEVVRTLRKDAQGKRIKIVFAKPDREEESASLFWTDEVKVYDILLNLIGNAVKYSPSSSRVDVELQVQRKGAEIKVRDEGPGIPRDELGLLFQPFFRGSIPTATGVQGLGLGLYVSQLYAKKLSGRIHVANNSEGRGATFTVYLPRQKDGAVAREEQE
jgi:signal transduction histidine kinase